MPYSSNRSERRQHARTPVSATAVVFARAKYVGSYLVEDLSAGGALLVGDGPLPDAAPIELLLQLAGAAPHRLSGHVLRRQTAPDGRHLFAVRFEHLSSELKAVLRPAAPLETALHAGE